MVWTGQETADDDLRHRLQAALRHELEQADVGLLERAFC